LRVPDLQTGQCGDYDNTGSERAKPTLAVRQMTSLKGRYVVSYFRKPEFTLKIHLDAAAGVRLAVWARCALKSFEFRR
jgi:hypothetical protein